MPAYDKDLDFVVLKIPMSNYQFGIYEAALPKKENLKRKQKNPKR